MRVHITELQVGDRLISDAHNHYGLHILSASAVLASEDIAMLFRHNIDYVEIDHRGIEARQTAVHIAAQIRRDVLPDYDNAIAGIKQLFEQAAMDGAVDARQANESFEPLAEHFNRETDIVSLLLTLNSKDDYTYQHSVQVGMYAYYIAKWSKRSENECLIAGKAGYLHDIGKSRIPDAILKKPSRLNDEEFDLIRKHTIYGHDMIMKSLRNRVYALAALQHHERLDRTGYPNRLSGAEIHSVAKIIAVADVFSAMTASRVYQKPRDVLSVMQELHRMSFHELDPDLVQTFIGHIALNLIGKSLRLVSGEVGIVVLINPADLFRPLIRIDDRFIDLSRERHLEIDSISV